MPHPLSLQLSEEERQLMLLALAHLSLEHPGFDYALNLLALKTDNNRDGRAEMYDDFRGLRRSITPHAPDQIQTHVHEGVLLGRARLGVDLQKPFPPFAVTVTGPAATEAHETLAAFMRKIDFKPLDPATAPKPLEEPPTWASVHDLKEPPVNLDGIAARFHRLIIGDGKPPVKVGFDIGGVLSKYPDILRPIVIALVEAEGIEVHVLSDMHPHAKCVDWVHKNGFPIVAERIHSCDYEEHGDDCKAVKAREIGLDVLWDDFLGYLATPGAPRLRLLVMPDATADYYHPTWQTDGSEGNFGRRRLAREVKQLAAVLEALNESGPVSAARVLADWTDLDAAVDAGRTSKEDALALIRRHLKTLHTKGMVVRREEEGSTEWKVVVGTENLEAGATYELTVDALARIAQESALGLAASLVREAP